MNKKFFWRIIEESRNDFDPELESGNMERQVDALYEILSRLKPREITGFNTVFHQFMLESYTWDLWGVVYILSEGMCSDDSFDFFRTWLISMGQEVYERALRDPDSLEGIVHRPGIEDIFFEEFSYVASEVYLDVTGKDLPEVDIALPPVPAGEERIESPEELNRYYPRLWSEFGWD